MGIQINGQTDTVTAIDGSITVGTDLTVPGVLAYDDVTNIDSVGVVTARSGLNVTGGNVGIGTDNPTKSLSILSSQSVMLLLTGTTSTARIGFNVPTTTNNPTIGAINGNDLQIRTGGEERFRVIDTGLVGIGTDDPGQNLTVNGSIESLCQVAVGSTTEGGEFIMRAAPQQLTGTKHRYLIDNYYGNTMYGKSSDDSVSGMRFLRQDDATSANGLVICTMDEDGIVRFPYQPIASLSHSAAVNVSNTVLTSSNFYDTIYINQGNHFNASTGRFTCPVDGVYRIYFRCSQNGNSLKTNVRLQKNGNTINEAYSNSTSDSVSSEAVDQCAAGDYLHIQVNQIHAIGGSQHKQVTFQLLH